jgi:uncharacterized protein YqfB (UPF0267 family)
VLPANRPICREPPGKKRQNKIEQQQVKKQGRRKRRRFSGHDLLKAAFIFEEARQHCNVEIFSGSRVSVEALNATSEQARAASERSFKRAIEESLPIIRWLYGGGKQP